jgi:hypothetical protein
MMAALGMIWKALQYDRMRNSFGLHCCEYPDA